ncbi:VWA domain-containing protein [Ramlibacter terrae]|uniref:VWA domain-containing protein n=1 Tax=Ramlibacter terrae TaxID=2732511 RepID=A0ABX6P0E1_9BURK|nr:VWA domain-containing protein [Ramlibacter terrae]
MTAATGAYTYTLNAAADNSATANNGSIAETFNYVGNASSAKLVVNIADDVPQSQDAVVTVEEGSLPSYSLVFVLDVSGSMTSPAAAGELKSVDENGVASVRTRLDMAKTALISLVNEYYSAATNVSIKLVTFSSTAALLNTTAYTTKESAIAAIDAMTGSGGTNYQDGLQKAMDAFTGDAAFNSVANSKAVYFLSDGAPSAGDITDPGAPVAEGGNGYSTYIAANGIRSYGVGTGNSIYNPTELNNIHNVDADKSGEKDLAILVPDVNALDEALRSTVPTAFGGSVTGTGGVQNVAFGADGGYVSSLTLKLDTNGDGIAETDVTFLYNRTTGEISRVGGFPATGFPVASDQLTLDVTRGFVDGKLVFNFSTGGYVYLTSGAAVEGDEFEIKFVVTDGDGDSVSGKQTVKVIDGSPQANNDTDSMMPGETSLVGNVVTGAGTDGSTTANITSFSGAGSGEDKPSDDAHVSSITFRGATYVLTADSSGSGADFSYSIVNGRLTWVSESGASLVFDDDGYYKYTPRVQEIPDPDAAPTVTYAFTSAALAATAALAGVSFAGIARNSSVEGSATVTYGADGAGVNGNANNTRADSLESRSSTSTAASTRAASPAFRSRSTRPTATCLTTAPAPSRR